MENITPLQQHLIDEIAIALTVNSQYSDYKLFTRYLKDNKKYWTKCILSDNRYLYGSLVKLAKQSLLVSAPY